MIKIAMKDSATPGIEKLIAKAKNLSPAFKRVEKSVMAPMARRAWGLSGLVSRSGELKGAITPWSGKKSVGVTLRDKPGKDLIAAKGHTHMEGRTKGKGYKGKGKPRTATWYKGTKREHKRVVQSPWGNIPARPFFVTSRSLAAQMPKIQEMIVEHITNAESR